MGVKVGAKWETCGALEGLLWGGTAGLVSAECREQQRWIWEELQLTSGCWRWPGRAREWRCQLWIHLML